MRTHNRPPTLKPAAPGWLAPLGVVLLVLACAPAPPAPTPTPAPPAKPTEAPKPAASPAPAKPTEAPRPAATPAVATPTAAPKPTAAPASPVPAKPSPPPAATKPATSAAELRAQFASPLSTLEDLQRIEQELHRLPGITSVSGSETEISVTYDPSRISPDRVRQALAELGHPVRP